MRTTASVRSVTDVQRYDLAESVARASSRQVKMPLQVGVPEGEPDWVNCGRLLSDRTAFPSWRAALADWLMDEYGEAPDRTTAGYVMAWYLVVPAYLAALLFHHERRVPSLRPDHLAFRKARPRPHPDSIALLDGHFVCLPGDPAAGRAEATVVPDERALAAVLRGRFTAHAARFVTAFAPTVRFGRHTLWATATDVLDESLLLAGRFGGDEAASARDAALVLPERLGPLTSGTTIRRVGGSWTRRREGCCFHYLLENGGGPCSNCPRIVRKFPR